MGLKTNSCFNTARAERTDGANWPPDLDRDSRFFSNNAIWVGRGASAYIKRCQSQISASIDAETEMWTKRTRLLCLWLWLWLCLDTAHCLPETGKIRDTDVSKFFRHLDVIPDVIAVGPQDFLNVSSTLTKETITQSHLSFSWLNRLHIRVI